MSEACKGRGHDERDGILKWGAWDMTGTGSVCLGSFFLKAFLLGNFFAPGVFLRLWLDTVRTEPTTRRHLGREAFDRRVMGQAGVHVGPTSQGCGRRLGDGG